MACADNHAPRRPTVGFLHVTLHPTRRPESAETLGQLLSTGLGKQESRAHHEHIRIIRRRRCHGCRLLTFEVQGLLAADIAQTQQLAGHRLDDQRVTTR